MGSCCGRPNNNASKGEAGYYERYAFLSSAQRERQLKVSGSSCSTCDAITTSDKQNRCQICGQNKKDLNKDG